MTAAPARKKTPAPVPLPSRALAHGLNAFGARYLRPGFATSPDLDLAFALGAGAGFGPLALLPDLAPGKKAAPGPAMHRNLALAELRGLMAGGVEAAASELSPIDEAEARRMLAEAVPSRCFSPAQYLALEALVGPSVVLEGVMAGLRDLPPEAWNNASTFGLFFVLKGFLLRATAAESTAAQAELAALYADKADTFAAANLGILLYGRPLVEQRGYRYSVTFKSFRTSAEGGPASVGNLLMCDADGPWVAAQFAALWQALGFRPAKWLAEPAPARIFFLGGDAALETELKVVGKYPSTMHEAAFASYEHLASPLAAACMRALAVPGSKVQARAEAWLAARG